MKKLISLVLIIFFASEIFAQNTDTLIKNQYFNEVARFYAGINQLPGSSISKLDSNKVWLKHQQTFTKFFDSAIVARINPMSKFAEAELKILADSVKSVLYPFSGPDFLHANIFFPNAEKIVMFGLERPGSIPNAKNLNDKQLGTFFKALRISLDSIFIWGYFMTNDMSKDFSRSLELRGLAPVLLLFMAKSDFTIADFHLISLNSKGEVNNWPENKPENNSPWDAIISGIQIDYFKSGESRMRTLYYFSHDVSDENLKKTPGFVKFLENQSFDATYLKAASYLCWQFNTIRKIALEKSKYVFQDDSGIEFKYFDNDKYDKYFWGKYTRPIGQFKWCKQPRLKEVFATSADIKELPFGIGYGYRLKESHLMLFVKK